MAIFKVPIGGLGTLASSAARLFWTEVKFDFQRNYSIHGYLFQKQPPKVFYKKAVLKLSPYTHKNLC